jgi:Asp-tRNA(Asn)/Glu-tRNA(Gln) amidotransferase A subunit family amidase
MMRALDLAEAVDAGDLTPAALVELCAERIAGEEAHLRAFAHLDPDAARMRAARMAGTGGPSGGLFGLPVGIKDIIDTAAMPTEYGSPLYSGHQPKADAPIVVMIEDASGILLGKTATTEFAYLNPAPTRNPHDPAHTPGGSSAGSAAAVAAGLIPLALGTQTGGSVIRPASFCGVAAMKPSYRLMPMTGIKPFAPLLDTLGLFGARVVDVAFGLSAITGRNLHVAGRDFGAPTFGITRLPFAGPAEPEAERALEAAIRVIERGGGKVIDLDLPASFAEAHAAHRIINNHEGAVSLAYEHRRHRDTLSPILIAALDEGHSVPIEEYDAARGKANRARKDCRALFDTIDAVLTFSAPGAAPGVESTGDARYNKLITLVGLPAVNVPLFRHGHLPVGVQVVGAFGDDLRALAAAAWLEARTGTVSQL